MLGLRTTIYKVSDLDVGKKWYAETFRTKPYFDEPFYVGFDIGGYELGLQPGGGEASGKSANVLTYWGVDDIQAEYDRIIALGATVNGEPTNVGGEIVVASVKDPWGNVIGIIYNPIFKVK